MTIRINRNSQETLSCTVMAVVDPGTGTVEFAAGPQGRALPTTAWVAGTWGSAITSFDGMSRRTAISPLFGVGALDLSPGLYTVFTRVSLAGESIIDKVGDLLVD